MFDLDNKLPEGLLFMKRLWSLTPREWEILVRIADDLTTNEMAEKLYLTPKSVENYRTRIGAKLGLTGHHKLAKFARKYADELEQCYQQQFQKLPPPEIELQTDTNGAPIN